MSKEPAKRDDTRRQAQSQSDDERAERDRRQRTEPDYLEKTKPEDPSARPGQLTRDNVNPNIPSGPKDRPLLPDGRVDPNAGGIVDPNTLGMESQEGAPPPKALDPDQQNLAVSKEGEIVGSKYSINEPPGSDVTPPPPINEIDPPPEGGARGAPKVSRAGPEASADPDDIEDELEQMKEEGDVETRGKSAPKKK